MARTDKELALGLAGGRVDGALLAAAHDLGIGQLDTAYNYGGFAGLDLLAALDAPSRFAITSKVGFFPTADGTSMHSLDPERLLRAVEDSVARLGAPLDTVLLHNPERAARGSPTTFPYALESACHALQLAVEDGLARRWGLSVWRPEPILGPLRAARLRPDVLMTRVGLTLTPSDLDAVDACRAAVAWPGIEYRGMAALGGTRASMLLQATDITSFVRETAGNAQAAVRVGFELPPVRMLALGTSDSGHLREANSACGMRLDDEYLAAYRDLLRTLARDPDPEN